MSKPKQDVSGVRKYHRKTTRCKQCPAAESRTPLAMGRESCIPFSDTPTTGPTVSINTKRSLAIPVNSIYRKNQKI
jgi:hypothetical protein